MIPTILEEGFSLPIIFHKFCLLILHLRKLNGPSIKRDFSFLNNSLRRSKELAPPAKSST